MTELPTLPDLTADFIRRVVTYTDEIRYFGQNSTGHAMAVASANQALHHGQALYRALLRRHTLLGASGNALGEVAEEFGVPRLGPSRALVFLVFTPWVVTITAVTAGEVEVTVEEAARFEVGDSVLITVNDGSVHEIATVLAKTVGTGPNGGDEINLGALANVYDPSTTIVKLVLRKTIEAGTVFASDSGISFELLDDVAVGDSNPVMAGESAGLALADKGLAEARTPGVSGNVEALTVRRFETPEADVAAVINPYRGYGGADTEPDFALKYRASHQPQGGAVETGAFVETLARQGDRDVLRAFIEDSSSVATIVVRVLTRSGGGLSADRRAALALYMSQRMRSNLVVEVQNVVTTSVEIEASISMDPSQGTPQERLATVWRAYADRVSTFLDWRKWKEGEDVDEADLLSLLNGTVGVANVVTSSFSPSTDVEVALGSVPIVTRIVLTDTATPGNSFGADLETTY